MFAHVIPCRRVPPQFEILVYQLPPAMSLRKGQIVTVPFRTETIAAIVWGTTEDPPPYATRAVLAAHESALTLEQIALMEWMHTRYGCSFTQLSSLFAPGALPKSAQSGAARGCRAGEVREPEIRATEQAELSTTERQIPLLKPPKKSLLMLEVSPLDRKLFLEKMSGEHARGQILYLVPEIEFAPHIENAVVYHGGLKEKERIQTAKMIASGESKIIIGTRLALFLPFTDLSSIIIDNEEHPSFIEKRTPHFDTLEVALKLSEICDAPCTLLSHTPRVSTWHLAAAKKFEITEWQRVQTPNIKIISLDTEREKGNYGIFAEAALEEIARVFSRGQQLLIFVNRKGYAGALYCRECGETVRCARCKKTIPVRNDGDLECAPCGIAQAQPQNCPHCGGVRLMSVGAGTDRIAAELKKIFANAKILRVEGRKKTAPKPEELESADALVATSIIDKPLRLPRLQLTLVADFEGMVSQPDLQSNEKAMHLLQRLRLLTQPGGTVAIQTYLPENDLLRDFSESNFKRFYERELATRELLKLPPFSSRSPSYGDQIPS